jgi:Asp-tRNA(Asn)/Glu-tRNA(Gln) amidotransferase A subunit family amidase
MLEAFGKAGAQIRDVEIPELDAMRLAHVVSIFSEMAGACAAFPVRAKPLEPASASVWPPATSSPSRDYLQAQRMRTRAMAIFRDVFGRVDAVITPSTAITAPQIPENAMPVGWSDLTTATELTRFAFPANLSGVPAISFPAGYDALGLPIGCQAMARWWDESLLLRIAHVAEQLVERRLPQAFWRLLPSSRSADWPGSFLDANGLRQDLDNEVRRTASGRT